jgi:hypothetical protein
MQTFINLHELQTTLIIKLKDNVYIKVYTIDIGKSRESGAPTRLMLQDHKRGRHHIST